MVELVMLDNTSDASKIANLCYNSWFSNQRGGTFSSTTLTIIIIINLNLSNVMLVLVYMVLLVFIVILHKYILYKW
jgi:hypothetical protein